MQDSDTTDVPPVIDVDRRHLPDRRSFWRGGRRNTDWTSRPIGAWRHLEHNLSPWRQWLTRLPLGTHGTGADRETRR
jgi:hypothetical protein